MDASFFIALSALGTILYTLVKAIYREVQLRKQTPLERDAADVGGMQRRAVACIAAILGLLLSVAGMFMSRLFVSWLGISAWVVIVAQCLFLQLFVQNKDSSDLAELLSIASLANVPGQAAVVYAEISDVVGTSSQGVTLLIRAAVSCILSLFLMCAYAGHIRNDPISKHGRLMDPEGSVSIRQRYMFAWANALIELSNRLVRLQISDLPGLADEASATSLESHLKNILTGTHQPLWFSLYKAHCQLFHWQWFLTVAQSVLAFVPQICVYQILSQLESEQQHTGRLRVWIWGAALGLMSVFLQFLGARLMYLTFAKIEVRIRAQLTAMVFAKALRLDDIKQPDSGSNASVDKGPNEEPDPDEESRAVLDSEDIEGDENHDETRDSVPLLKIGNDNSKPSVQKLHKVSQERGHQNSEIKRQVINLTASDTIRIAEISSRQHIFIGSLFTFSVALIFLVRLIGWVSFCLGLLAPMLIIPLNMHGSRSYGMAQGGIMKARDMKVQVLSEVLSGIRQIKFTATEDRWEAIIMQTRDEELVMQRKSFMWAIVLRLLFHSSPILLAVVALSAYALLHDSLSATIAFTALGVFANLEFSISVLPMAIMQLLDGLVSAGRIQEFLQTPEKKASVREGNDVCFHDATIAWPASGVLEEKGHFSLNGVDARFPRHALSIIFGPSGSGKSLLLASIIGEAAILEGTVTLPHIRAKESIAPESRDLHEWIVPGMMAFVAQVPWIENASIKENILFGLPMDPTRYQAVLKATALVIDLKALDDGDLTEVGARGINLSGGQRWRLTFARALYSRAEILVLDDILSAVDAHVGAHLLDTLDGPLCRNRTRILATHHVTQCLPRASYAIRIDRQGNTEVIAGSALGHGYTPKDTSNLQDTEGTGIASAATDHKTPKALVEEETREEGAVKWKTHFRYMFASGGPLIWILVLSVVVLSQLALLGRTWWIKQWTESERSLDSRPETTSAQNSNYSLKFYLGIYILVSLLAALMEAAKCSIVYFTSLKASASLFRSLLQAVLRARPRWLDTVPIGRILNRFTADFALIDTKLPGDIHTLLSSLFALGVVLAAGILLSPYIAISSVILLLLTLRYAYIYMQAARDIRRLESTTKSPILDFCGTSLDGMGTIRAYGSVHDFAARMRILIDEYSSSSESMQLLTQWLAVRVGLFGSLYAMSVGLAIAAVPSIDAPLAGLALAFAFDYNKNIEEAVRRFANLQVDMTSTERVLEYAKMDREGMSMARSAPPTWPSEGSISFCSVSARYAPGLPEILKELDLQIPGGQRVGIVGRTGSGKSSLALALFRFIDISNGTISIDGLDISSISLTELRSRMTIVPQDPTLFSGTLRSNLDPLDEYSDDDLHNSLHRMRLIASRSDEPNHWGTQNQFFDNLDSPVSADGLNLSQGQRQLLCLARATLARSKILIMDEATSAIDQETDELIQSSIRTCFASTTLLVIAHRLKTVIDFDRIIVMQEGRVAEFGAPSALYHSKGAFWALLNDSGDEAELHSLLTKTSPRSAADPTLGSK